MQMNDLRRFLEQVHQKINELKAKLKEAEDRLLVEGEWSPPMTKKEMGAILGLKPRAFNAFAKSHPLRRHSRQLFQIRIDGMDSRTRKKFEKQ